MNEFSKESGMNLLRMAGVTALFTVIPGVIGGLVSGPSTAILVFAVLSLLIPLTLRRHERLQGFLTYPWHNGVFLYNWLGWLIFFYMGNGFFSIPVSGRAGLVAMMVISFVLCLLCMYLGTWLVTLFAKRDRHLGWFDEALDISVYSLPIPMLILGDVLFIRADTPMQAAMLSSMVFQMLVMWLYAYVIITMAVIAVYLYPRHGEIKGIRMFRILITAGSWLAIMGHLMYGWLPDFVKNALVYLLPVFQGSFLVYVTPGVMGFVTVVIAVAIGTRVETLLLKWRNRKQGGAVKVSAKSDAVTTNGNTASADTTVEALSDAKTETDTDAKVEAGAETKVANTRKK